MECKIWVGATNSCGYGVKNVGGRKIDYVHRIAWKEAHGPIPPGYQIHHRCEERACYEVEHLELVTPLMHSARHSKLSEEEVAEIRRRRRENGETYVVIGRDFGCDPSTICRICRYQYHRLKP